MGTTDRKHGFIEIRSGRALRTMPQVRSVQECRQVLFRVHWPAHVGQMCSSKAAERSYTEADLTQARDRLQSVLVGRLEHRQRWVV